MGLLSNRMKFFIFMRAIAQMRNIEHEKKVLSLSILGKTWNRIPHSKYWDKGLILLAARISRNIFRLWKIIADHEKYFEILENIFDTLEKKTILDHG